MSRRVTQDEERLLDSALKNVRRTKPRGDRSEGGRKKTGGPSGQPLLSVHAGSTPAAKPPRKSAPETGPFAPIDKRTELKLKRGRIAIEARLDLHGLTQSEAHRRLVAFIARSAADELKAVLVITGKGTARRAEDGALSGGARGVLRANVPLWLEEPACRAHVLGIRAAGPRHGGSGALYVLLRRPRSA